MFKNKSIGTKVSLVMTIVIIIALGVTSLLNITTSTGIIKNQLNSDMEEDVDSNADLIAEKIELYKTEVEETASKSSIQTLDWSQQLPVLKSDLEKYKFKGMAFSTTGGQLTKTDGSKADITERDYFKEAMQGETAVSDPELDMINGELAIHLAVPVKDGNGNIKGIVVAILDGQELSTLSKDAKGSASGYGYILNEQGTVIGHKNEDLVKTKDNLFNDAKKDSTLSGLASVATKIIKGQSGIDEYTYKGSDNYAAYTPIKGTSWFLISVGVKSEIMNPINSLAKQSLIISAFFILFSGVLCILLISFLVTKPLKKSLKMIEELSKGHLKGRLDVKSNDEVGKMSAAMNILADKLQNDLLFSMKQIAAGNINIEITAKNDADEITPVILETAGTVREIVSETQSIIDAVNDGVLDKRCDDSKYTGEWKILAQKINSLCGVVAKPIDDVRRVLGKITKNDLTDSVNGDYSGVFKDMADDVNELCKEWRSLEVIIVQISKGDTHTIDYLKKQRKTV